MTAPAAIALFIYFLRRKEFGKNTLFNRYGENTLWIYILHPVILGVLIGVVGVIGQELSVNLMNSMILTILITLVAYFVLSTLVLRYSGNVLRPMISKTKFRIKLVHEKVWN